MAKSESSQPANPGKVAMRVKDILAVIQPIGTARFEVFGIDDSFEDQNAFGDTEFELDGNTLAVKLGFSFRGSQTAPEQDEDKGRATVIEIDGTFVVFYELENGEEIDQKDLETFSQINGRLNVVPYWREFVSSSFVRAGLPPYTVPVFNPAKMAKELAEKRAAALIESESSSNNDG